MITLITHVGHAIMLGFFVYFCCLFGGCADLTILKVTVISDILIPGLNVAVQSRLTSQSVSALVTGVAGPDVQMFHRYVGFQRALLS